jgi:hypothetical protein
MDATQIFIKEYASNEFAWLTLYWQCFMPAISVMSIGRKWSYKTKEYFWSAQYGMEIKQNWPKWVILDYSM